MKRPQEKDWLQDLKTTNFIIQLNAGRLKTDREQCTAISAEFGRVLAEQEAKLLRHFARIVYLKRSFGANSGCSSDVASTSAAFGASASDDVLRSWLSVVNVSKQAAEAVVAATHETLDSLLDLNDRELCDYVDSIGVLGEDRRRLLEASTRLRSYTRRWLEDGCEPVDVFRDVDLCWVSYDRLPVAVPRSPSVTTAGGADRRSVSESGVDSGASDSGVGSNVSQTSLPTTTPPPSPGYLMAVGVSARGGRGVAADCAHRRATAAAMAKSPRRSSKGGSSTPPPTLRWGTAHCRVDVPRSRVSSITRSHSHESNLPNRIGRDALAGVHAAALPTSRSAAGPLAECAAAEHVPSPCISQLASPVASSRVWTQSPSCPSASLLSPTSPSPAQAQQFFDASQRYSAGATPKSPRSTGRILHLIPHQWRRQRSNFKHLTDLCGVCKRPLGFGLVEKCKSCKYRVHPDCKLKLGDGTCGLTPEHLRYIVGNAVDENSQFQLPQLRGRAAADAAAVSSSRSSGAVSEVGAESVDSSSSTNSSAPSTPANAAAPPLPSPLALHSRQFTFPEVPEVPDIVLPDEAAVSSQGSDQTLRTVSMGGQTASRTASQELTDSADNEEASLSGFVRGSWTSQTIKYPTASWRDVKIAYSEIRFGNDSLVGEGLFGSVYRGFWHMDVAVKLLRMDHVDEARQLDTFKREVAAFKNTRHENIVLFVGYCLDTPQLGIVMNFCKGFTLHRYLHVEGRRFELIQAASIAVQIVQGMSYLHAKDILHKDLRTKNIFVENNNKVVITDFGLFSMRRLWRVQQCNAEARTLRVPHNWLCYLSPELMVSVGAVDADGQLVEPAFSYASDVYSFGTVWFELLTGEAPFRRLPAHSVVWQVGRGIKPPLADVPPTREMKDMLMQCWAFSVEERPDFNDLLKTLERIPRRRLARSPSQPVHAWRSVESMY